MTIDVDTKLFGNLTYSSEDGVDIEPTKVKLNEKELTVRGLIFEDLTESQIKKAIVLLDNLEKLDAQAKECWLELCDEEDEDVCGFADTHYNDLGEDIREDIFKKLNIKEEDHKLFIENLTLGSFHIGEDEDNVEITMDYSLIWEDGEPFGDEVLAIIFDDNMEYVMHSHDT